MARRLLLLNGLGILAVVINHAAQWGHLAMFWWTYRYRDVSVPNYDQLGGAAYYILVIAEKITVWSVPAFLFISGYFVVYAARGIKSSKFWKIISIRITHLLYPYLTWSIITFIFCAAIGQTASLVEYIRSLFLGEAAGPFFYIPLLVQLYLLSPIIVQLAKKKWVLLLIGSGILQLATILPYYLSASEIIMGIDIPSKSIFEYLPTSFFARNCFFFVFGVIFSMNYELFMRKITAMRRIFPLLVIIFAIAAIIETETIFQFTGITRRADPHPIFSFLYAFSCIILFIAYNNVEIPFKAKLSFLGKNSLGIYLSHFLIITISAKVTYHIAPKILGHQLVFVFVLVILGVLIPLAMMKILSISPVRNFRKYVFG